MASGTADLPSFIREILEKRFGRQVKTVSARGTTRKKAHADILRDRYYPWPSCMEARMVWYLRSQSTRLPGQQVRMGTMSPSREWQSCRRILSGLSFVSPIRASCWMRKSAFRMRWPLGLWWREALGTANSGLVPPVCGWGSSGDARGWVLIEHMPGEPLADKVPSLSGEGQRDIVAQIAWRPVWHRQRVEGYGPPRSNRQLRGVWTTATASELQVRGSTYSGACRSRSADPNNPSGAL